jgi:hypothetical protein
MVRKTTTPTQPRSIVPERDRRKRALAQPGRSPNHTAYRSEKKVAPLVRQVPWSHNLIILGQCKRPEERESYLRLAIREILHEGEPQ